MKDTPNKRKFYKKTILVEFLSEDPFPEGEDLDGLVAESVDCYSMNIVRETDTTMTSKQAARELLKQGSDPSFFRLTEDGSPME